MIDGDSAVRAPGRVLVTKIGLDGHDRGSRLIASFLRDAGMEVIYTPPWQQIEAVVKIALEEDVDVIGVSSLATDHLLLPQLVGALKDAGLGHVQVTVGGIIPEADATELLKAGVARVFQPGASRQEVVEGVTDLVRTARDSDKRTEEEDVNGGSEAD